MEVWGGCGGERDWAGGGVHTDVWRDATADELLTPVASSGAVPVLPRGRAWPLSVEWTPVCACSRRKAPVGVEHALSCWMTP